MLKAESLLEVISVKLSRFDLEQIQEVALSVDCIEAGKEAVGTKVSYLLKELASTKTSLDYQKSECERLGLALSDCLAPAQKSEKLEKKVKDLRNELRSVTRKWNIALDVKEEAERATRHPGGRLQDCPRLEFAVCNLQETILKLRGSKAA